MRLREIFRFAQDDQRHNSCVDRGGSPNRLDRLVGGETNRGDCGQSPLPNPIRLLPRQAQRDELPVVPGRAGRAGWLASHPYKFP
jgi:hypothetical protein